jgi:hypothetical protein
VSVGLPPEIESPYARARHLLRADAIFEVVLAGVILGGVLTGAMDGDDLPDAVADAVLIVVAIVAALFALGLWVAASAAHPSARGLALLAALNAVTAVAAAAWLVSDNGAASDLAMAVIAVAAAILFSLAVVQGRASSALAKKGTAR